MNRLLVFQFLPSTESCIICSYSILKCQLVEARSTAHCTKEDLLSILISIGRKLKQKRNAQTITAAYNSDHSAFSSVTLPLCAFRSLPRCRPSSSQATVHLPAAVFRSTVRGTSTFLHTGVAVAIAPIEKANNHPKPPPGRTSLVRASPRFITLASSANKVIVFISAQPESRSSHLDTVTPVNQDLELDS